MNKEFVPYELADKLKNLGFDETCFGYWNIDPYLPNPTFNLVKPFDHEWCIPAPLYQQAFRWFREKYRLVIQYIPSELDNSEGQSILHHQYKISEYDSWRGGRRNTVETELNEDYEEAELACLIKLIEITRP